MKIAIIDYGAGNVFSVTSALKRLGCEALLTADADEIKKADRVIFPGVGQASAAMENLRKFNLDKLIPTLTQPVLGICLGMQLLCRFSEEENTLGLGIIDNDVKAFVGDEKIPHMGWNNITNLKTPLFDNIKEAERMYFVHSYYVPKGDYTIATCNYIHPFSAAVKQGNFFGCQFHPEKSSIEGSKILANFINNPDIL